MRCVLLWVLDLKKMTATSHQPALRILSLQWRSVRFNRPTATTSELHSTEVADGNERGKPQPRAFQSVGGRKADAPFDPSRSRPLSWRPRAFVYDGFLSDEECDHLISLAKDKIERPAVGDGEHVNSSASELRTVPSMFIKMGQDEIVTRIEQRIATWTFLPVENGKDMEILHYEDGQQYKLHSEDSQNKSDLQLGGPCIATVLMFLSEVRKGGESVFPVSKQSRVQGRQFQAKDDSWSACAKKGYAVKPKKGDALLFFNLHSDATADSYSLHESCAVVEGDKWSATKWIHTRGPNDLQEEDSGECVDRDDRCSQMAALGACKENLPLLVGPNGFCRKSCGACAA